MENRCHLCKVEEEAVDHTIHILLYCAKMRILWHFLFSLFNVDWVGVVFYGLLDSFNLARDLCVQEVQEGILEFALPLG